MHSTIRTIRALRTIGHEERLSLVDHLDELRSRLIIGAIALAIAFGVCLWQNHALLRVINAPLKEQTRKQVAKGEGTVGQAVLAQKAVLGVSKDVQAALGVLSRPESGVSKASREALVPLIAALRADVARIPRHPQGDNPATLGVGEPFTTTITVSLAFALIATLPVILYELYGFILPALRPNERHAIRPLVTAVPILFVAGVLFGYFVVLPAAVRFFVNFNSEQFNIIVQAAPYYRFAATILLAMGLVFQVPVVILGATRSGLVTPQQLRKNRRYAILACAVIAAFLPGDAITLVLETVPLYLLYEASILLAVFVGRSRRVRGQQQPSPAEGPGEPAGEPQPPNDSPEPQTVQQIIDHVDRDLSG
jgi:sec-independent protein translocase protein TatC